MRREHARAVRKEKNTSPECERTKTITEGDGLWLYQGMVLGVIPIRVRQRCDAGAWSLERQMVTRFLVVDDDDRCDFLGSPGKDTSDGFNGEGDYLGSELPTGQSYPVLFPTNALVEQFHCLPRHFPVR